MALHGEREAQKQYWMEHSTQPTVEAMMLDSKAAEIDKMERPEVRPIGGLHCCMEASMHTSIAGECMHVL